MRWILLDEFRYIKKGKEAQAVKSVSRAEESMLGHFPHLPILPSALMIEMMAQVGGVLVGAQNDFKKEVLLAKVVSAEFFYPIRPPEQLVVNARQLDYHEEAALTDCDIFSSKGKVAQAQIFFGIFDSSQKSEAVSEVFPWAENGNGSHSIVFSEDFLESFSIRRRMENS